MASEILSVAEENVIRSFVFNPSRGIVVGRNLDGEMEQFAWTMGRSKGSQNRRYEVEGGVELRAVVADPGGADANSEERELYTSMRSVGVAHIVTNGDQTDAIFNLMKSYDVYNLSTFNEALSKRHCEDDAPIFTPRISAFQKLGEPGIVYLSLLRADPSALGDWNRVAAEVGYGEYGVDAQAERGVVGKEALDIFTNRVSKVSGIDHRKFPTQRFSTETPVPPGLGYCLTTYLPCFATDGDARNLRTYVGVPFLVPLPKSSLRENMEYLWSHLDERWKVSLGGRRVSSGGVIRMEDPINVKDRAEAA